MASAWHLASRLHLMVGPLSFQGSCQSFVTSVAPYQTFRKQSPRKQIINNEIRRCYPKRNRALGCVAVFVEVLRLAACQGGLGCAQHD